MNTKSLVIVAGFGLLLAALPAAAHHAFAAEFDVGKPVEVTGKVTKLDLVNPHSWLYVDVTEPDGKVTNWRFELGAPNALFRLGWKKDTIPAGLAVVVTGFRAKFGGPVANGRSVKLPSGKTLESGGSNPLK
ncbi:MAG TPA: DUF6152 family protein [Terriglobia bacterium]|nr:DUF6152 family protein [Terriglobia bacterium]